MTSSTISESPLTDDEVAFIKQIIWEQFRLTAGPAWRWFIEQELPLCELGPFTHAMNQREFGDFFGQVIDDQALQMPVDSFVVPWANKADFLNRLREIQEWLDRRKQNSLDSP